jgi:hypothetical protein
MPCECRKGALCGCSKFLKEINFGFLHGNACTWLFKNTYFLINHSC